MLTTPAADESAHVGREEECMRMSRYVGGVAVAVIVAVLASTVPAHATVHEIVAQWCSGQPALAPPGISDDEKKNFAQPLNAAKIVITIVDPVALSQIFFSPVILFIL